MVKAEMVGLVTFLDTNSFEGIEVTVTGKFSVYGTFITIYFLLYLHSLFYPSKETALEKIIFKRCLLASLS